ncbi:MAG: dienelactone hydrolase family protein [Legionellaceae bacterium]|nr:dienelactone hydrolase family protein [Legionellaceae bacterium]
MHTQNHIYYHDDQALHAHVAFDNTTQSKRPAVLVFHDWSGRNEFACVKAEQFAEMGYVGFAADLYGAGVIGTTNDEKQALMAPLMNDRLRLFGRLFAALDALAAFPEVDETRVAAVGYCFGGLCALDLARTGASISGVVSFHGLLKAPNPRPKESIHAKVLALHGFDDPMVPPEDVTAFCHEMTEAHADWQMHMYGQTTHAFTNPEANDPILGTRYSAKAEHRSFQAMTHFLTEIFA